MTCRPWLSIVALSACAVPLTAQGQTTLPPFSTFLKANSSVQRIATDATGNVYVVGQVPANDQDVFVAKLNPANAGFAWIVYFGGSSVETAGGLAVDAAGNAYITGSTTSPDFPTTPQTTGPLPSDPSMPIPFAAKVSTTGVIVYSTLFSSGASAVPAAIAVDGSGDAIISGIARETNFTNTPGAYNNPWSGNPPFVTKLDPTGKKVLFSVVGVGGSSMALDAANNIFVSGSTYEMQSQFYPTTPGAFQTTFTPAYTCDFLCQLAGSAPEQYITKLSADGSKLLYSTFLTGSGGSSNAGLAVDAAGDAWVTGETPSTDYPYTVSPSSNSRPETFTTELDPTGSKVLLSVQQGGSSLTLDPQGNIVLAGSFPTYPAPFGPAIVNIPTPPAPPTGNIPAGCLPNGNASILSAAFAMRLSGQDGSVLGLQIIPASLLTQISSTMDAQGNIYVAGSSGLPDIPLTSGVAFDPAVTQRTVYGAFLVRVNLASPQNPVACVTDSPTSTLIGPVAPGQLITLYGNGLGPTEPIVGIAAGAASVPTSLGGVSATFNGTPAPLLYVSPSQINVQVPLEIQQSASAQMQVMLNGSVIGSRLFSVVPLNPSLFVDSGYTLVTCRSAQIGPVFTALALNQDGTVNSCANPAKAGSELSLFVNGLGVYAHNQVTGGLTSNPGYIATFAAVFDGYDSLEVDSFTDQPGAISGLGWIQVHVPDTINSALPFLALSLSVNELEAGPFVASIPAKLAPAVVFVRP